MPDTPESLINVVIAADDLRRRARGQPSTRAALSLKEGRPPRERLLIEPFFNVLGLVWGELMYFMPWSLRKPYVQWVMSQMSHHAPEDNPHLTERISQTVQLAHELKTKTGQWPALLVLTSHPDTEGPLEWLRFELLRQGVQVADAYTEARWPNAVFRPHPKCFLAIDPFALDTVSTSVGGFYSGWMHRIYLAWDRQPSTQSWIQKQILLRGTGYAKILWRLLACLKADVPVLMVLSGGLPYNARLLYATREFVHHLKPDRWRVTKRTAQIELMEILMKPDGNVWPADKGELTPHITPRVREALERWGIPVEKISACMDEFTEEFKLSVPSRARLFRILAKRVVERGKPLILVAVSHREAAPHVVVAPPVLLENPDVDITAFSKIFVNIFAGSASKV